MSTLGAPWIQSVKFSFPAGLQSDKFSGSLSYPVAMETEPVPSIPSRAVARSYSRWKISVSSCRSKVFHQSVRNTVYVMLKSTERVIIGRLPPATTGPNCLCVPPASRGLFTTQLHRPRASLFTGNLRFAGILRQKYYSNGRPGIHLGVLEGIENALGE